MRSLSREEAERVYKVFIEKANSIILIWDEQGYLHHVNEYGAQFFGYSKEELIGQHVMLLVPDVDSRGEDLSSLAENILEQPEKYVRFTNENIKKNDERVWITWTNAIIENQLGLKEVLAIGNDVTELRQVEDKLRIEGDKLRAVLENIQVGVGVTDKNGNTISLNPAALDIHGFRKESEMLQSFIKYVQDFELQYPDGKFMPVNDWPSSRAVRGEYVQNFEVKLIRKKSGTFRFVNYSVTPVFDRYGEVTYFVFNMVDITERKAMEDRLLSKNHDLERANRQLGKLNDLLENLLYIAAHDLKGPLNNFRLGIELYDMMKTDEEKLALFNKFRSNYFQLDKTIRGLTEILEMQQIDKCHIKTIDLENCIREVLKEMSILTKIKASITWDFHQADTITYVSAYFASIMKNLISNAIKYRKPDKPIKIHIESTRKRDKVIISVQDNGIGIDLKKDGKELFKPFRRFAPEVDGTGVGLYLVRNMITENGGRIEVESEPGKGTIFNCFFKEYKLD
jgi:PAS domain S-box-containing protein